MPALVEYRPDGDYVYMQVLGEVNARSAVQMIRDWIALEREHGCHRVLTDYREARLRESVTGMYGFVGKMESLGIPREMKMACITREDTEDHVFFETVARNQGWQYRLFDTMEEAEVWLTGG